MSERVDKIFLREKMKVVLLASQYLRHGGFHTLEHRNSPLLINNFLVVDPKTNRL